MISLRQSLNIRYLLVFLFLIFANSIFATSGNFEISPSGIIYVVRDTNGNQISSVKPEFDPARGQYYVKDSDGNVIAQQVLVVPPDSNQIRIVAPVKGDTHSVVTQDFTGNTVPVLHELSTSDPRYQQLSTYIDSSPGLKKILAMQIEARNLKINRLQQEISQGSKDPELTNWLINDLKKPLYVEIGDSGGVYSDPAGFILAEQAPNGQISYQSNALTNRIVVPPNSEIFNGGMNDSAGASLVAHEVGHVIMGQVFEQPNYPKAGYSGPHSKSDITDEGFAISEGWAEALETLSNDGNLNNPTSWRLKTQKNIIDNKYIFQNQGKLEGVNDGLLKTGIDQLSTEGVNATLFYKMLQANNIQAPFSKVLQVFEQSKPQTYRDFVTDYIQQFPEDRSTVIKQFLDTTKYTTVDSQAVTKYKELFDAQQAMENSPHDAQLKADYRNKLAEYDQWSDSLYKKTVVTGKIDSAIAPNSKPDSVSQSELADSPDLSQDVQSQFQQIRFSENVLKGKIALSDGMDRAANTIGQSFSAKNLVITAGAAIAVNVAHQLMNGEKVNLQDAAKSVASWQFVGNVAGSTIGAAAGQAIAPLIQTFVPIPVVGALAGALLPTMTSIIGGQLGSGIGAGQTIRQTIANLDPVAIAGQSVGSTIGMILGSMIPIPVVGSMVGGIVGGIIGEKIFKEIESLFKKGPVQNQGKDSNIEANSTNFRSSQPNPLGRNVHSPFSEENNYQLDSVKTPIFNTASSSSASSELP
ncbi:MAG: hypothetical protein HQM08_11870 [Candidatus Riflebacteria bacterium]|nr:hypothetical protein [Candidatus Riflebacteria bacterium]